MVPETDANGPPGPDKEGFTLKHAFRDRARVARLSIGLIALAVPLVGASGAQGAIGQTSPASTAAPDLVSGNVVAANLVQVCFDQPVDVNSPDAGDIQVGGYKSDDSVWDDSTGDDAFTPGDAPVSLGNNCVRTSIAATDLEAYTIVSVAAGTVRNEADVTTNLEDSAPLIGSTTQNGTRGNSTGPDLLSVIVLGPENDLVYNFDQDVDCANAVAPDGGAPFEYQFVMQNGNEAEGDAFAGCDDNQVRVSFAVPAARGLPGNVSQARSAWVFRGGAFAFHVEGDSNPLFSVDVAGGGITVRPDLRSAELQEADGSSSQMVFTFDENVTNPDPDQFTAIYSDSPNEEYGDTIANILNGNQVVVNFDDLNNRTEYVVGGSIGGGFIVSSTAARRGARCAAVAADNPAQCAVDGGKPAGGNQNAFAIGWTTGPDAVSASVNQGAGQVRVLMDQRYDIDDEDCASLVNSDGQLYADATSTTEESSSIPNVVPVAFNFSQNELLQAVGLYINGTPTDDVGDFTGCNGGGEVSMFSPFDDSSDEDDQWPNVDQVFSIR